VPLACDLSALTKAPNFHGAEGAHAELPQIPFQKSEALTLLPFLAAAEYLFYVFASFGGLRKFQMANNPMRTRKTSIVHLNHFQLLLRMEGLPLLRWNLA
jgi:hypothetical protein